MGITRRAFWRLSTSTPMPLISLSSAKWGLGLVGVLAALIRRQQRIDDWSQSNSWNWPDGNTTKVLSLQKTLTEGNRNAR
jgi:hypothetical protein